MQAIGPGGDLRANLPLEHLNSCGSSKKALKRVMVPIIAVQESSFHVGGFDERNVALYC